jgi:hypothetical protein
VRHELVLATHEIREDLRKTKTAMLSLGIGIGVAALSGLLLILMLPHVLNALAGRPLEGLAYYRNGDQLARLTWNPQTRQAHTLWRH